MDLDLQTVVSLFVVTLSALYLLRRGRRFYLSLRMKGGARCGGCSSCGLRTEPPILVQVEARRNDER